MPRLDFTGRSFNRERLFERGRSMKRLIVLALVGLLMVCPSLLFAAGASTTATCANYLGGTTRTITYSWVGDDDGGAVTSLTSGSITCPGGTTGTTFVQGYRLCGLETSTTVAHRPSDNYDLYLYDSVGGDLMGKGGENRDENATEFGSPGLLSGSTAGVGCRSVTGAFTFTLSGNSANSAAGVATFFFEKP